MKDHLTWLTYVWPSTNPFLRTLVCGLFKIPGFSGRRYFNRLVPTPFFGTRLRRQNFNLAPTQYRQLRRLFPSRPVNLTVVTGWAIRGSLPSRGRRLRFKPQIITMKNIVLPYDYSKPKKEKMLMVLAKFFQKWKIGSSTLVSLNWTVWWKMIFVNIRFHMTETLPLWCSRGN